MNRWQTALRRLPRGLAQAETFAQVEIPCSVLAVTQLVSDKHVTTFCMLRKRRVQAVEASLAVLPTAMTLPEETTCLCRVRQL